jgi:hypothetical protein
MARSFQAIASAVSPVSHADSPPLIVLLLKDAAELRSQTRRVI